MLRLVYVCICMVIMTKCEPIVDEDVENPMKFRFPSELPDQNQDGYADNQDF